MGYIPCSVKYDICINFTSIIELESGLCERLNLSIVLDLNLAVDDHLGRADVCTRVEPESSAES